MNEIAQMILYIIGIIITFIAFWYIDFNRFIRINKKEYAIFVYIILSIAIGFLLGKMFVEIGILFKSIVS